MWGEHASDVELERAARELLAAVDIEDQIRHLKIFAWRRFPLAIDPILVLASDENRSLRAAALIALENIAHLRVRSLAFELIETRAESREYAIGLLAANEEPGDHEIALSWFEGEADREILHGLGRSLEAFAERCPDRSITIRTLRALYEKGPCSYCREAVVARMIAMGVLDAGLRAECAYDANDDIRAVAG